MNCLFRLVELGGLVWLGSVATKLFVESISAFCPQCFESKILEIEIVQARDEIVDLRDEIRRRLEILGPSPTDDLLSR